MEEGHCSLVRCLTFEKRSGSLASTLPTYLLLFRDLQKTFDDGNTEFEWHNDLLVFKTNYNVDADQSNKRKTKLEFL